MAAAEKSTENDSIFEWSPWTTAKLFAGRTLRTVWSNSGTLPGAPFVKSDNCAIEEHWEVFLLPPPFSDLCERIQPINTSQRKIRPQSDQSVGRMSETIAAKVTNSRARVIQFLLLGNATSLNRFFFMFLYTPVMSFKSKSLEIKQNETRTIGRSWNWLNGMILFCNFVRTEADFCFSCVSFSRGLGSVSRRTVEKQIGAAD